MAPEWIECCIPAGPSCRVVVSFDDQTVVTLETIQPFVSGIDSPVVLERIHDLNHLIKRSHESGIVTCRMYAVTAPPWNRLRVLPPFPFPIQQVAAFGSGHRQNRLGHGADASRHHPRGLPEKEIGR